MQAGPAPPPTSSSPSTSVMSSAPVATTCSARSSSANGRGATQGQANNNPIQEVKKDVSSGRGGKSGKPPGSSRGRNRNQHHQQVGPQHHQRGGPKQPLVHHYGGRGGGRRRGQGTTRPAFGDGQGHDPVTQADEFEVGSVFHAGSKKHNMNHLLNFQFEPRGVHQNHHTRRMSSGTKKKCMNTSRPKYNKEQYLQANCQFVVKECADYSAHLSDPDTMVDWDLVEQVGLKSAAGVPSCPICLYPPTAAKIARCGHVFCWTCILHYLALSDNDWRKCPICFDSIYKQHLKSVVSVAHKEFQVDDVVEMVLMRRERNSLFAVPVGNYHPGINIEHPSVTEKNTSYSKLLKANKFEVANLIISRERKELEQQFREEKEQPEACFIEEALGLLKQRENGLFLDKPTGEIRPMPALSENEQDGAASISACEVEPFSEAGSDIEDEKSEKEDYGGARPRHMSSSSEGSSGVEIEEEDLDTAVKSEDLDLSSINEAYKTAPESKGHQPPPKETFYFYQSSDGQAIFLHALNVQMLVKEHGSLENCPPVIKGKMLEKDATSMDVELRNKLRYLRHLPLTCSFEVCELDLASLVSKATMAEFAEQVEARRRRRSRRAREERRREKRIMVEENKRMGKYPEPMLRIESAQHYPPVGTVPVTPTSTSSRRTSESVDFLGTSPPVGGELDTEEEPHLDQSLSAEAGASSGNASFANILRKTGGSFGSASNMVRSKTSPAVSSLQRAHSPSVHVNSDGEEEARAPPSATISDMIQSALEQAGNKTGGAAGGNGGGKGKKKGKKNKGISLLQTVRPSF